MEWIKKQLNFISTKLQGLSKAQLFFLISTLLLLFFIPFHRVASSIPTIFLVCSIVFLIIGERQFDFKALLSKVYLILFALLFLWYFVLSLVHPSGSKLGLNLLWLIPLYFISFLIFFKHLRLDIALLIRTYLVGLALFSIFILSIAILNYQSIGYKSFLYIDLLRPVKANPIIHSMFYNLAIVLSAYEFKLAKSSRRKTLYAGLLMLFMFMVVLCAAKIGYIVLIFTTLSALSLMIRSLSVKVLGMLIFLGLAYTSYQQVSFLNKKIDGFVWQLKNRDKISLDDQLPRSIIWPLAIKLIEEHPMNGLGVGNTRAALLQEYVQIDYTKGVKNEFNAHNQFLETGLQVGMFGMLVLFMLILYCYYIAIKHRSMIYLLVLVILTTYLLVESLFESQMGTVCFGVFNGLFINYLQVNAKSSSIDSAKPSNL